MHPAIDLEAGLARLGYESFRPGQREAIELMLDVGRLLLVAPTGGGKSLTYQLPASLMPGTTLVVSPLISLMNDQVLALDERGLPSTFLAGTLSPGEMRARMGAMARGEYKLVYVAPERLGFDDFRALLANLDCPLVAIDEAHCISEWGHDFRPEYLQIGRLLRALPKAHVLACTATATPVVRDEILDRLGLGPETPQLVRGFARPNLALRVHEVADARERRSRTDAALREALGAPGEGQGIAIVYAPTRKAAGGEARRLAERGWRAVAYHAGLEPDERAGVTGAFARGELEIVAATNAFGMGIDRPDVRAVVHLAPPASVEAYYQEVGRAGRDGAPAVGLLLMSAGDLPRRRFLIESDAQGGPADPEAVRHKWGLYLELMRYAEGGSCRHDTILRYFGDEAEALAGCGVCDVCRQLAGGEGVQPDERDSDEAAIVVRKALSAVARIHGRYGLSAAGALLRGAKDPRLATSGLDLTKTFGALEGEPEEWLQRLLRRCVTAGWVDFDGGDRPVAVLTEIGVAVMRGERDPRILLPPRRASGTGGAPSSRRPLGAKQAPPEPDALDEQGLEVFEALRAHRLILAQEKGVPPYVIASDRALRGIAAARPRSAEALLDVHGMGPSKVRSYGPGLLEVVSSVVGSG